MLLHMTYILWTLFSAAVSGFATATLTSKLDEYMEIGNIFGGMRRSAAKYVSEQIGMDWTGIEMDIVDTIKKVAIESEEYHDPIALRVELYEQAYRELAFAYKRFKVFICQACMSEWVNIPVSISIGYWMVGMYWELIVVVIGSSIVSRWFLD